MRCALAASVVFGLFVATAARAQDPPTLDVWPGEPPGEKEKVGPETTTNVKRKDGSTVKIVKGVSRPTIAVYSPANDKDTGTAVLVCPGGGYNVLAMDLEGEEVAAWLNSIGVTGIVLKYRVPRPADKVHALPLMDAQRAMSLVRSHANDWHINSDRIGILGFSAGGHLAAATSTNFDKRRYEPIDAVDKISARPDFAVLIYPAYLAAKDALQPDIRVSKKTPPTFFAHAGNDGVSPENSIAMYLALKRADVPAELHVYANGGHGFGLRRSATSAAPTWPARCEEWLRLRGLLQKAGR